MDESLEQGMERTDLVVVGAGIFGLTSAATYHRLNPEASILILDAADSFGGTWSKERLFPGLKTNNQLGMYEHPDFPMSEQRFGVRKGEHIHGANMNEYLGAFVDENGLHELIRSNTKVEVIKKAEEGWSLQCLSTSSEGTFDIITTKLIIAIGNTNKPKMPKYPTSPAFEPVVIHSKELSARYEHIVRPNKHTLVIGGGKSAWDVAYACATQPGATVTLLIRPSGNGPNWMAPSHVTPFKLWLEKLVFTRFFGFMSPCPWARTIGLEGWIRALLHRTRLGRMVVSAFWKILGDDVIALNKLHNHPETEKLVPWRGAFEVANDLSIHNYPTNFYDLVREGKIKVVIDEVERFGAGWEVLLKDGGNSIEKLDAVVCATGWEACNTIRWEPESLNKKLALASTSPLDLYEAAMIQNASHSLREHFPILDRNTSRTNHPDPSLRDTRDSHPSDYTSLTDKHPSPDPFPFPQPKRLHRFMVPPNTLQSRSLAFAGALYTLGTYPAAYIQSLWISAYFADQLPLGSHEEVLNRTYRDSQYCALRAAGGYGRSAPDLVWDTLPYFDVLMEDLGMGKGMFGGAGKGMFAGHGPEDWRGCVGKWEERMRDRGDRKKGV
ncbi:hypothetical protein HBI82_211240 [Parastagonospora nodorum]|nr:hypothetical protein HBH49_164900 [Parastagonospora nodorum]KAH4119395.1 hypothetical protein HBH47_126260 [Parastagonospora nodorum]KAH4808849.1 hypothetical protein HBH61_115280 [Parastagonospora nodorum]KAH5248428.1 hypothetical protein HBI71_173530 [Parastagonospora nodorum]KAH5669821.1 hypothetical protein HBI21_193170 [Parastagonospora nodorum]